ncbi:MAG: hypothetical protein Q7R81_00420 [Candidatus Peregrinibacteria bacterium]|nr:hypothetical protein [Candidatus Peregrinibacteria bacterium]
MSNTHTDQLVAVAQRWAVVSVLVAGIVAVVGGTTQGMSAQMTGPGATVQSAKSVTPTIQQWTLHSAAVELLPQTNASALLAVGLLLIIGAIFLHALFLIRRERPVHVTVVKRKVPKIVFMHFDAWLDKGMVEQR